MKRRGFTLAEVLITLGIIGVVAALTAPALVQNAGSAQTGPKLAKAVSTWEVGCENLLTQQGANKLHAVVTGGNPNTISENLGEALTNYVKMSHYDTGGDKYGKNGSLAQMKDYNGNNIGTSGGYMTIAINSFLETCPKFLTKDGTMYLINMYQNDNAAGAEQPIHKRTAGKLGIDINGVNKPNRLGKDLFVFDIMSDGTLSPIGTTGKDGLNMYNWFDGSTDKCNETTVTSGLTCSGSIFENDLKVIYQ